MQAWLLLGSVGLPGDGGGLPGDVDILADGKAVVTTYTSHVVVLGTASDSFIGFKRHPDLDLLAILEGRTRIYRGESSLLQPILRPAS